MISNCIATGLAASMLLGCSGLGHPGPMRGVHHIRTPAGCYRFGGTPSLGLDHDLEVTLLAQVSTPSERKPLCWYQLSATDLFLEIGDNCLRHDEITFHHKESEWSKVSAEVVDNIC